MNDATQHSLPRDVAARFVPVIRQAALRVARRLPSHVCVDDLIGAGYVGLVEAYRRFDPARCDRFEAYAELRIKGAMLDELRATDPLSRDLRALATRTAAAVRGLQGRLGRGPSDQEIAQELGLSLDAYRAYATRMAVGPTSSLDDGIHPEIGDSRSNAAEEAMIEGETRRSLGNAVAALPDRLRQVLDLYYREELTLREIGDKLGVTESRVCQLHSDAVRRLRAQYSLSDHDARLVLERRAATAAAKPHRAPRSTRPSAMPMQMAS